MSTALETLALLKIGLSWSDLDKIPEKDAKILLKAWEAVQDVIQ